MKGSADSTDSVKNESAVQTDRRILIVLPKGILSALYAEPSIRAFGRKEAGPKEITVCHENADLFISHPAVHALVYGDVGDLKESFDRIIYLRDKPGKGAPMDWIYDVAHQLGVTLEQQTPQITLTSFDFVRTQRFGIFKMPRPRVALATASAGWHTECRQDICRILYEKMHAGLVYVGACRGEIETPAKDLRGKLMAREIAAVLKQCDLLISDDEEIVSLASAVKVPTVYICRKSWDSWPAEEGAWIVSVYPEKPEDVLEAIRQLGPVLSIPNMICGSGEQESKS